MRCCPVWRSGVIDSARSMKPCAMLPMRRRMVISGSLDLHLFGGCLIDPATGTDTQADLFISEGQIAGIGAPPPDFHAHSKLQTLDARGLVVIPGLVDLCARFGAAGRAR